MLLILTSEHNLSVFGPCVTIHSILISFIENVIFENLSHRCAVVCMNVRSIEI